MSKSDPRTEAVAKDIWFSLPLEDRTARKVAKKLTDQGFTASKSTVDRWRQRWTGSNVTTVIDAVMPDAPQIAPLPPEFHDIPRELQDVLSPRLLALSKGEGLDRVEDAVIKLAGSIAKKADAIAEMLLATETETETTSSEDGTETKKVVQAGQVARSAIAAVATLATAMQTIVNSRNVVAMSHRHFSEGDRAKAEGYKFMAEAHALNAGRPDRAREINPNAPPSVDDEPDDAISAMRDVEQEK